MAAMLGGRPWVRHFAFPACFILTAVPWPSDLENPVIDSLMRAVAATTVGVLNAIGTLALQQGNLIETRAGLLGIDEACSGVRSLQATLMISLFLGEFHRFPSRRSVALIAAGIAIAFATNVARAFFLAWTASREGLAAVARWHDSAGFTVAVICFVLVAVLAAWMARRPSLAAAVPAHVAPRMLPSPFIALLGAWLVLALVGTELWFRSAPVPEGSRTSWSFSWPAKSAAEFREVPVEPRAASMLRADEAQSAAWLDPSGAPWLVYHFRWAAGSRDARVLARIHHPENCLPAAGWTLAEDRGVVSVKAGADVLPFRALRFVSGDATAHVWFCRWEDGPAGGAPEQQHADSPRLARLFAVLDRRRSLGQQVLEAVFLSPLSAEEADAAFRREIAARIDPS
jgi:exosortase/archaeosortase family protein